MVDWTTARGVGRGDGPAGRRRGEQTRHLSLYPSPPQAAERIRQRQVSRVLTNAATPTVSGRQDATRTRSPESGPARFDGHRLRETTESKAPMTEPVIQTKRTRKNFDKAFKQRAVELWLNSGKAATEVAAELGIHAQRLSAWRSRFAPPPPGGEGGGGAKRTVEQLAVEISDLRRENEYLRQQRDILKKTLGILSEPPSNGFNGSK